MRKPISRVQLDLLSTIRKLQNDYEVWYRLCFNMFSTANSKDTYKPLTTTHAPVYRYDTLPSEWLLHNVALCVVSQFRRSILILMMFPIPGFIACQTFLYLFSLWKLGNKKIQVQHASCLNIPIFKQHIHSNLQLLLLYLNTTKSLNKKFFKIVYCWH